MDNPDGTKARRNEVLRKMAELGMITRERAQTEMAKGLGLNMDRYFARARERYVLDYVKSELIKEYGASRGHEAEADKGWHFLKGDEKSIARVAAAAGFEYQYDEDQKQWGHPSVVMITMGVSL